MTCALGIGLRAVARHDLHSGVLPEPLRHCFGGPIWEQGHGLPALQVHEDRAIGVPFPQGKIVHPEDRRGRVCRDGQPAEQAQQRVPAHGQTPALAQADARLAPQGEAHSDQALGEP